MLNDYSLRATLPWIRYAAMASTLAIGAGSAGCSASDVEGGTGANGAGTGGTSTTTDGGLSTDGGLAVDDGTSGDGEGAMGPNGETYCQQADVTFVPKTPTVYVLVDRSSSMFGNNDYWGQLKAGVLPVIQELQADVRFGFGSYTGTSNSCTGLTEGAPIAENNYDAIESEYNLLGAPGDKAETPTPLAVEQASAVLLEDESPGDRFILLVTDGNPDFCNDPNPSCGADALIASLQVAASQGVRTLVFGIENEAITPEFFEYFAQAGQGEEPNWSSGLTVTDDENTQQGELDSQCNGETEWVSLQEANGNESPYPAGNYSEAGGTASAFLNTDAGALATEIQTAVEGLKSCTFDLGANNVEVKEGQEGQGDIFVDDELIPADQWQMNSTTQLELLGDACDAWQMPEVTEFFAGFPCEALTIK